ncbi:MAG: LytTR family transcriptional regulator [Bacteroidales bacterium]|nr:LytTR family transcriptional regulator [Bacteroidales bacterium]
MILTEKLPKYLLGKYQLIGTVTFSVLFAVVFLNIYIPFSETAWFALGDSTMFLHTLFFIAISILILICSRMLMYRSKTHYEMTYLGYMLWCILEIVAISGFYTWFTTDVAILEKGSESIVFIRALRNTSIALGLPYLISGMYFAIIDKNNTIRLMNYENVVTDETTKPEAQKQKITLFDNSGALKLSLNPENLYYIESDDNYIKVWYTDSKCNLKQYILRCRLKTVEEDFKGSPLVRCHRKYIVNLSKVSMLRKESDGYVLDLDNEAIPPITVTKTYMDAVLSHFTEQSPLLEPMED